MNLILIESQLSRSFVFVEFNDQYVNDPYIDSEYFAESQNSQNVSTGFQNSSLLASVSPAELVRYAFFVGLRRLTREFAFEIRRRLLSAEAEISCSSVPPCSPLSLLLVFDVQRTSRGADDSLMEITDRTGRGLIAGNYQSKRGAYRRVESKSACRTGCSGERELQHAINRAGKNKNRGERYSGLYIVARERWRALAIV